MKGSDAMVLYLREHGVSVCFEVAGGMITHILDSISQLPGIEAVSMHHEQAAAFAAEGVSRITKGKQLGVALATSGPGATNLVTGIASCWFDSIPCLFITGQVNQVEQKAERPIRQQGFQEMDVVSMVNSFVKCAFSVRDATSLLPSLHQAIECAYSGRKGPVLLDISYNSQTEEIPDEVVDSFLKKKWRAEDPPSLREEEMASLAGFIHSSRRPLVCIGGGGIWAEGLEEFLSRLELSGVPFVTTLMGAQWVQESPHYLGMIGTYGRRSANWAVQNCDLMIVLGSRMDIRQTGALAKDFARKARKIQIDIDPAQLNNRIISDLSILADVGEVIDYMNDAAPLFCPSPEWSADVLREKEDLDDNEYEEEFGPNEIFSAINEAMRGRPTTYTMDVGNHQMWAACLLRLGFGQSAHYSGGHGAMGFGLPAALGMSVLHSARIVNITGDGSLQMNSQELDTLSRLNSSVTLVVLDNESLGMVRSFQDMYFEGRHQSTVVGYSRPDFVKLAQAYGLRACSVSSAQELLAALNAEMEATGPGLIHVRMAGGVECRPRLAFGAKLDEQLPLISHQPTENLGRRSTR